MTNGIRRDSRERVCELVSARVHAHVCFCFRSPNTLNILQIDTGKESSFPFTVPELSFLSPLVPSKANEWLNHLTFFALRIAKAIEKYSFAFLSSLVDHQPIK